MQPFSPLINIFFRLKALKDVPPPCMWRGSLCCGPQAALLSPKLIYWTRGIFGKCSDSYSLLSVINPCLLSTSTVRGHTNSQQ